MNADRRTFTPVQEPREKGCAVDCDVARIRDDM